MSKKSDTNGNGTDITLRDVVVHVEHMEQRLSSKMTGLETCMTGLETRMTGMGTEMKSMEKRLSSRMDGMEKRLTERIDALDEDLTATLRLAVLAQGQAWGLVPT